MVLTALAKPAGTAAGAAAAAAAAEEEEGVAPEGGVCGISGLAAAALIAAEVEG